MTKLSERRENLAFAAGLLLLFWTGVTSYQSHLKFQELTGFVTFTESVLTDMKTGFSDLQDAETGQRGFLITGDEKFLDPFRTSRERIDFQMTKLSLASLSADQVLRVESLKPLISRRFQQIEQNISLRRGGRKPDFGLLAEGRDTMDEIRGIFTQLEEKETELLNSRLAEAGERARHSQINLLLALTLACLLVLGAAIISNLDIQKRKKVEADLREARIVAEAASNAKSRFLANMSHEIRTPMNAILGMAEVLSDSPLNAEQKAYVSTFKRAGATLLHLINDILDLSKVEAGKLELEAVDFDLKEALETCREILNFRASQKGLTLTLETEPNLPRFYQGDPNRLKQVLLNLLGNAVKFTAKGTVRLTIKSRPGSAPDRQALRFEVTDTGIGIAPEHLKSIFEPFTQADGSVQTTYGGTGLGLNISKRLIQLMGGAIEVSSQEGAGSRFFFDLDLPLSKKFAPATLADSRVGSGALRILLVDDSEDNRLIIKAYLKKSPHEITTAENGAIAFEKFKAATFDLVFMDMHMPVMDGYATVPAIREWEGVMKRTPTPIVALTAYALKEEEQKSYEIGCTGHLTKPVSKATLLGTLAHYCAALQKAPDSLDPVIKISKELEDLVPGYLNNRKAELLILDTAVANSDFPTLQRIGHNLRGSGSGYGLPRLSELGTQLEAAAKISDLKAAAELVGQLRDCCTHLKFEFVDAVPDLDLETGT